MVRRVGLHLVLGALLGPAAAWAHGPSGGGPDDPEASARNLAFDTRLAEVSRPPDERPLPWVVPGPATAASARPPALRQQPASLRPRAAGAHGMAYHAAQAFQDPHAAHTHPRAAP
ncbi:MAG: hypothetical protein V4505_09895 [Pseudomonadota bacterium]